MRGLIPIAVVGSLIIMVVIIIFSGILLMRVFSKAYDTVVYFFGGFFSPPTPLEKALICYYHICANTGVGCRHPNVDKWCRDVEIYPLINYEEICTLPSALKVDGEQCRKAYWQFPLRINLSEPQEVRVKTLRSKRNVDSGKEHVYLLRPEGVEGKIYTGSKYASFTIGRSVELVNFVNEENLPPSYPRCPKGNICLESATVDKSSYEISGIIYKKGGIYVPVGAKWTLSTYYSFYWSGQSREVIVDFMRDREIFGNERLLRISVDAEKRQDDQLKDYNYILGVRTYSSLCRLWITFVRNDIDSFDFCDFGPTATSAKNCKNFVSQFITKKGGRIIITVKDIKFKTYSDGINEYCDVDNVTLNITYRQPLVR
jgi:hypothetical protein